jgi:hypothetical protein
MPVLSSDQLNSLVLYMNDATVLYPQRVRYLFFTCKEQVSGQHRIGIVKRLDQVLAVALLMKEEWHDSLKVVLSQAVELNALHSADYDTFLSHLVCCTPAKSDRPPARQYRRMGQPRAY